MSAPIASEGACDTASSEARVAAARARLAPIADEYPFAPRFHAHPSGTPAAGASQHFVDEGPRTDSALVFVHGNPTWSFAFRGALAALRSHRRCIAVDHLGCGLSDKPAGFPYRLRGHVECLERLLAPLALRRVTLVLHDWGGPIGLGWARRHPELVERLVLCNTAAFPVAGALPLRLAACRWPVVGKLAVRGLNAFARAATFMAVERPLSAATKRGYLLPYDSWESRIATHEFVADIPLGPEHPSWDELAAIERALPRFAELPVHFLWGARDWVFTPRILAEWRARFPRAETLAWEDAGHYLFEDRAADFVAALARIAAAR